MQVIDQLKQIFSDAIKQATDNGALQLESSDIDPGLERPKDESNGDFASTIAMRLAKQAHKNPREIAQIVIDNLPQNSLIDSLEIAGPGFINIRLKNDSLSNIVKRIREQKFDFAKDCAKDVASDIDKNVNLEYISANPTGPMHVGHGRWAALGDSISRIMKHAGYNVYQEFYLNDHGVQMNLFANSIYLRYLQEFGQDVELPDDAYGGDYVKEIAQEVKANDGDKWLNTQKGEAIAAFREIGMNKMLNQIKQTLEFFGNDFDMFYSESSLYVGSPNKVDDAIAEFKSKDLIYEKDGATWFKTTNFDDDKDRVIIKENGEVTYFLSDCAYHFDKLQRGFDRLIDIWGADHHGYIPRMKSMIQA